MSNAHASLPPDIPDDEILLDSKGREISDDYVDVAVADALLKVGRGRPSLSDSGESPLLRVRVSPALDAAVTSAAERAGVSRADWVRQTLSAAAEAF